MRSLFLVGVVTAIVAAAFAGPAVGGGKSVGPPGGTIYAFDTAYKVIATPTDLPDRGPSDTLYTFPDCSSCVSVSDAAPGHVGYNGGRWKVVAAYGITTQLTNAEAVVSAASSIEDTGTRFVCPLIPA